MNKPIFCIVGESGAGKSTYINLLLANNKYKLKELKYCSTRSKRYKEEDTYYFMTNDEYFDILNNRPEDIIESRMYEKYDEKVYYFTLKENLEDDDCDAFICASSVDQTLSYIDKLKNVYIIDLKVNIKERIKRLLERANTYNDVLELCRRILEEQEEYSKIEDINTNIIHIYNDNSQYKFSGDGDMLYTLITSTNLNTIKEYIFSRIKK